MAAATMRRMTELLFVASLASSCGTEQSKGATTGTGGVGGDAGDIADAADPGDVADADTECSFTACGGDLVGDWTIRRVCPASVGVRECPAADLQPKDVIVSGTFSFESDGGLTFDIKTSGTWEGLVPASCVVGTDCETIAQTLYQVNAPPASCTSDGDGGCNCSSPATPAQMATMPYRVSGNTAANMLYCVRDGLLKLQNEAGTVFVASK